jgi:formylglycine-generating enzyme required for sulfatase activity
MAWMTGGTFLMGSDRHYPEERPSHNVTVAGFWMDQTAVTNRDFARFVAATGHKTIAERPLDCVVLGSGKCVEEFDSLQAVLVAEPRR